MNIPERAPIPQPQENDAGLPAQPTAQPLTALNENLAENPGRPELNPESAVGPASPGNAPALPPDLRSPLHGFDLLFLILFYLVGGVVLYIVVAGAAMALFGVSVTALEESAAARTSLLIVSQALLSGATVAFLYGIIRSRGTMNFWPAVGWRPLGGTMARSALVMRYVFLGILLAFAVGYVSRFLDQDLNLPMEGLFRNRQSALLLMALGILVAPIVEETVFRGCIYPVLARKFGVGLGVAATGILFGLAHAPQLWPGIGQIALLMGVGTTLTYIRARAGTVTASYLVHLGYNTVLFAGFFLATGGLRHLPS